MSIHENELRPNESNKLNVPQYSETAESEWKEAGDNWRDSPQNIQNQAQTEMSSNSEGQYFLESANTRPQFNIGYDDPIITKYKSIQDALDANYSGCVTEDICLEESTHNWEEKESCFYEIQYHEELCYQTTEVTINVKRRPWLQVTFDGNDEHVAFLLRVDSNRDGTIDRSIDMPPGNICFYRMKDDIFGDKTMCWRLTTTGWVPVNCPSGMTSFSPEWNEKNVEVNVKNQVQRIWGLPADSTNPIGGLKGSSPTATRCGFGDSDGDQWYWSWEVILWEEVESIL